MLMRAHEWLGTSARGRWPVGPPGDCLSAAQSAASPTGSIPPRRRRNRQTGIRPPRHDPMGPALTRPSRYISRQASCRLAPSDETVRDTYRLHGAPARSVPRYPVSRADRRPRRLRGHGEAVWRISWPPAVRDEPVHRGRPCHQAGARGTPFRGSRGSDPVTARSRGRLRGPITVTEWWPGAHMWVIPRTLGGSGPDSTHQMAGKTYFYRS